MNVQLVDPGASFDKTSHNPSPSTRKLVMSSDVDVEFFSRDIGLAHLCPITNQYSSI